MQEMLEKLYYRQVAISNNLSWQKYQRSPLPNAEVIFSKMSGVNYFWHVINTASNF